MLAEHDQLRYSTQRRLARGLHRRRELKPGMSAREAADVIWTLASERTYLALVRDRGWKAGTTSAGSPSSSRPAFYCSNRGPPLGIRPGAESGGTLSSRRSHPRDRAGVTSPFYETTAARPLRVCGTAVKTTASTGKRQRSPREARLPVRRTRAEPARDSAAPELAPTWAADGEGVAGRPLVAQGRRAPGGSRGIAATPARTLGRRLRVDAPPPGCAAGRPASYGPLVDAVVLNTSVRLARLPLLARTWNGLKPGLDPPPAKSRPA